MGWATFWETSKSSGHPGYNQPVYIPMYTLNNVGLNYGNCSCPVLHLILISIKRYQNNSKGSNLITYKIHTSVYICAYVLLVAFEYVVFVSLEHFTKLIVESI
jgi:hypothetical protein